MRDYHYLMNLRSEIRSRFPLAGEDYDYTDEERMQLKKLDDELGETIRILKKNR